MIKKWRYGIFFILVAVLLTATLSACGKSDTQQKVAEGVDYIKSQEAVDAESVASQISEKQQQRYTEQFMAQIQAQLDSGELDSMQFLSSLDTVILGDSRTLNFSFYMDDAHALGEGNANIRNVWEKLDQIAAVNPRVVVLAFGLNDLGQYYYDETAWPTVDDYIAEMMEIVAAVQSVAPNARIYINSILECLENGYDYGGYRWRLIPEWNVAIKAYCQEHSDIVGYVDMTPVTQEHPEYYTEAGVHFMPDFCLVWADEIAKQVMYDMSEGKFN